MKRAKIRDQRNSVTLQNQSGRNSEIINIKNTMDRARLPDFEERSRNNTDTKYESVPVSDDGQERSHIITHRIGVIKSSTLMNEMDVKTAGNNQCPKPYSCLQNLKQALTLMAQAIMAMSHDNIFADKLSRQGRVRAHWVLQAFAAIFIFAGFLVIVINKNLNDKPHFVTIHSIVGLIAVILVGLASSGGVATLFSLRLKMLVRPAVMKLVHNILGIVTFSLGVICTILGLFSKWFSDNGGYAAQVICTVVVALAGVLTLESAVKSAYASYKTKELFTQKEFSHNRILLHKFFPHHKNSRVAGPKQPLVPAAILTHAQYTQSKKKLPSTITPEPALRGQQCSLYLGKSHLPTHPFRCAHAHNSQTPRSWHCEVHNSQTSLAL
uniref:ascorbate ferrireductase (transmembrane) n=1 Tax=Timema cristinae TaxID=61476 RepID=A0A7R9D332_TIMCR|nr:unnamed protein product [Timema cristinae]